MTESDILETLLREADEEALQAHLEEELILHTEEMGRD